MGLNFSPLLILKTDNPLLSWCSGVSLSLLLLLVLLVLLLLLLLLLLLRSFCKSFPDIVRAKC